MADWAQSTNYLTNQPTANSDCYTHVSDSPPRFTVWLSLGTRLVASGNLWSGPIKSFQDWFHWSAPLVFRSNWLDRLTESESGSKPDQCVSYMVFWARSVTQDYIMAEYQGIWPTVTGFLLQVVWRKSSDPNPLTVGRKRYVDDNRVMVEHMPMGQDWHLLIKQVGIDKNI